jgi:hypothetical protein
MITDVSPSELWRASVVKKGLLQENRIKQNIQIGVAGGDHENPSYNDGLTTTDGFSKQIAWKVPVREFGGGEQWWRRGVVRVECFYVAAHAMSEELAHVNAYQCLGMVMQTVANTYVSDLKDEFGEKASLIFVYENTFFESGGPPKAYIFRGKVLWAALTGRP